MFIRFGEWVKYDLEQFQWIGAEDILQKLRLCACWCVLTIGVKGINHLRSLAQKNKIKK